MRRLPLLLVPLLFASATVRAQPAPRRAAPLPPSAAQAFARAEALLVDPGAEAGTLALDVRMAPEDASAGGVPTRVLLEVILPLAAAGPVAGPLRVTLLAATLEGDLVSAQTTVDDPGDLAAADAWVFRETLEAADELHGAVALVEDLGTGRWGAAPARLAEVPSVPPPGQTVLVHDDRPAEAAPAAADADGGPSRSAAPADGRVIAVLPPRDRPATGRTRIQTLVTTEAVRRVELFVDGAPVATDERPPFSAEVDLGPEARPHTLRAVAYDRSGVALGEHTLEINLRSATPFTVTITDLRPEPSGAVAMEARVSLPSGAALDRVEVYRNDEVVVRRLEPPYRATVAAGVGPSDFVRVVAHLADGTTAEDVRFLAGEVAGERVEVNLVELFAVVTGEDGEPVAGLGPEDFQIEVGGRPRPVERFQLADEVPLTLALAVDTSESMWPLMIDARQAAARFLVDTLIPGDRACLVAFSDRPRLVAPATADRNALLRSFSRLRAGGATALYDSIVFSLVQLQEASEGSDGRRAVVLLTDGQDYGSRFRPRRVIDDARAQGTPVYVISLAGLYNERGNIRKPDLEAIANHTGGRTYYIADVGELSGSYDQINRELRTQYVLAFGTERPLSEKELRSVRVKVKRPGLDARVAVEPAR